ncbi:MAG: fasciclin domain-containing protein [Nannocystaceae bacterium]
MKFVHVSLATLITIALAACAGKSTDGSEAPAEAAPAEVAPAAPAAEADDDDEDEAADVGEDEAGDDDSAAGPSENLLAVIKKTPDASRFLEALESAGLDKRLTSVDEDTTLIIPSNAAFDGMSKAAQAKFKKNPAAVLQYHMVPEKMDLERVMDHRGLPTLLGQDLPIRVLEGTNLFFGTEKENAKLVESNIAASNGMAHIIDKVLVP